jgi:hypothetical protein
MINLIWNDPEYHMYLFTTALLHSYRQSNQRNHLETSKTVAADDVIAENV